MDPAPASPTPPATPPPWWKTAEGWKGALPWWFRHAKRAATVDYDKGVATEGERLRLAAPAADGRAVASRRMQDFLAWRRSMLSVATPLLLVFTVLASVDYVRDLTSADEKEAYGEHFALVQLLWTLQVAAAWVLALTCLSATRRWATLPLSHRRLRLGWAVGVAIPVVLLFIPRGALFAGLHDEQLADVPAQFREPIRDLFAMALGLVGFGQAVPVAFAVFFGFLRAGFATMKLCPESVVGGLAVSVGALLLALFALPLMVLLIQAGSGNVLVILGALVFLAGLVRYVVAVQSLAKPRPSSDFEAQIRSIRRAAVTLVDVGLLLLLVFGFTFSIFGKHMIGFGESALAGPYDLLKIAFEFGGRSIATAVLFTDVLAAVAAQAWEGSKSLHGGPLRPLIEERVAELESVGVAELRKPRVRRPAGTAS